MEWGTATKQQLITIALSEDCPIDFKYRAVAELQRRKQKPKEILYQVVYLFGKGMLAAEIAKEIGISITKAERIIDEHQLWRGKLHAEKRKKKATKRGRYIRGNKVESHKIIRSTKSIKRSYRI